jgi:selenocysteine lyase/cysteine desulfurase
MSSKPLFNLQCLFLVAQNLARSIKVDSKKNRSIYMDAQATTPLDPRVLDAMMPLLTEDYGNAHSRTHVYGNSSSSIYY